MKFKTLVIGLSLATFSLPVAAQEVVPIVSECFSPTAEITTIREPQFDTTKNVWNLLYSEDGMDVFSDMVQIDATTFVAVGAYTKDKEDKIYHPLLVKYDERLKPVWAVREESAEHKSINRILMTKDGFTVLGDINDPKRGSGIYIASYDAEGKIKGKAVPFFETGGDLDGKNIVPAQDGSGYLIAAQFIDSKDQEQQHGLIYKISKSGTQIWKRSFKTGRSTVFNNIQTALDGTYMVTGQMVLDGNISGAWFLRVDENGSIKWQRNYPRGIAATFQAAGQTKTGNYILVGKARPVDYQGKGLAAWIMKTDSTGNPLWQRYLKGDYSYEARDVIVYEDGRASVLLNGAGLTGDQRSHARLATFSPQGQLQHLEDFTDGQNATANKLISGYSGERVLAGHAQTSFGDKQEGNEASAAPVYTYDAWLSAAVPLDTYDDPCAAGAGISPILP